MAGASLALPLSLAVVGVVTVFAVASVFVAKRKGLLELRKRRRSGPSFVSTPCPRSDSAGAWAFTDPESGSPIHTRSGSDGADDNSRTLLDARVSAPHRDTFNVEKRRLCLVQYRPLTLLP